ncbi:MAG: outer membrane beta-barrel protein [Bacteroidales bacterium]|nr:outer membrane beta-barrel protein [Bacteroidales bacterium]
MKKVNDIFRENVEKAFITYNADHLADKGWKLFVVRKKVRRSRAAVIPVWVRAASVVLLIGLGVFFAYKISMRQTAQEIISGIESEVKKDEKQVAQDENTQKVPMVVVREEETKRKTEKIEKRTGEKWQPYADRDPLLEMIPQNNESIVFNEIAEDRFLNPVYIPELPATVALKGFRKEITHEDLISADLLYEVIKAVKKTPDEEKANRGRTIMAGLSGLSAKSDRTASPTSGLSMGFYVDQKLTKRISIRPGMALAMQSLGLENGNSPDAIFNNPIALNDGTDGIPYSYSGHLTMLSMELPLNLVFRIVEKNRSGLYLSAGASTMIYISQTFNADFVNAYTKQSFNTMTGEYSSETRYSTVEVENNYGAFSRADFLGLANLSAGYSFPYSKTGTLLIEPFVQLPFRDLTSLNLRVRYGGISMKMQFGKKEKEMWR